MAEKDATKIPNAIATQIQINLKNNQTNNLTKKLKTESNHN